MNWYAKRWDYFWFEPAPAARLGWCRALFFSLTLALYFQHDFSLWGTLDSIWWHPTSTFAALHIPLLSPQAINVLQTIWKTSLALCAIGLCTRASTWVATIAGVYLLGIEQCFGKIHHDPAVFVFIFLILACSRCADAISIDAALKRKLAPPSGEYTWPIHMAWLVLSIAYFAAGLSKLKTSGLHWVFSENIQLTIIAHYYPIGSSFPISRTGLTLAQWPWICQLLAAGTLVIELGYPLAIFSRRARWAIVPCALIMHVVIMATVGPQFWSFMIASIFWIPFAMRPQEAVSAEPALV